MSKKEEKKKKDNKPKLSAKENKKRLKEFEKQAKANESNYEMIRLFKILIGVIGVLALFGFVFAIIHGDIFKSKKKEKEEIQNIEIMAGTAFSRPTTEDVTEYYVLFYDFDGANKDLMNTVYNAFNRYDRKMKFYKVNLGSILNKTYVANTLEEVNTSNNKDLKVMDPTLIKVSNGAAVAVYTGKEEIVNFEEATIKVEK